DLYLYTTLFRSLHIEPESNTKKVALKGTMVYDEEKKLVLDIEMSVHPDFIENLTMRNRIFFRFKRNNVVKKTIFNIDGNRNYLPNKMGKFNGTVERETEGFKSAGNYELVIVGTKMGNLQPNPDLIYHEPTLERLGKNYTTPYWEEHNTLVLSEKEKAVLGRLNEVD